MYSYMGAKGDVMELNSIIQVSDLTLDYTLISKKLPKNRIFVGATLMSLENRLRDFLISPVVKELWTTKKSICSLILLRAELINFIMNITEKEVDLVKLGLTWQNGETKHTLT